MFAPKAAKASTKASESPAGKLAHQSLTVRPYAADDREQVPVLQWRIGNQTTLSRRVRNPSDQAGDAPLREAERTQKTDRTLGLSWDFGKIRLFPPDHGDPYQAQVPLPGRPSILAETPAVAEAVRRAAVENHAATPPTQNAFSLAAAEVEMRDDASADRSARLLGAQAVAFGNQILFGRGHYEPNTERGRALIAHELTHVAHQRQTGRPRPQRSVGGDVLSVQVGPAMADAMTDDELSQQIQLLRSHLATQPDDAGAAENLATLEESARRRQAAAPTSPAAAPAAPGAPAPAKEAPAAVPYGPPAPDTAPAQDRSEADKAVAAMSQTDKLVAAYNRANIDQGVRNKLASLFTPQALVAAIIGFAVTFLAAQFTPVGWAADLGLALTSLFVAGSVLSAMQHLVNFAAARNATTDAELTDAGGEFAAAVGEVAVDAVILFLTHGLGGAKGGGPYEGPPPPSVALAFNRGGQLVFVASSTIAAEEAAQLGLHAAAVTSMMAGTPQGASSGFGRTAPTIEQGDANQGWVHIEARHVTGSDPGGDLFAPGTTRAELQEAAEDLVDKGLRKSDPKRTIQTFERRIVVHGRRDLVRVVVNTKDNTVVTIFPVITGP
jgi:hypothetical protein